MTRLSKNFTDKEFRCPCCGKILVDERLIQALQKLRDLVKVPIIITSGYRCAKENERVGGVEHSYHTRGMAADIHIKYMLVRQMYKAALKVEAFRNGGIGLYPDNKFVHVDVRSGHARWAKVKGDDGKLKQVSIGKVYKEES